MSVKHGELDKTADFYVKVFGMRRVRGNDYSVLLTDEVVCMAIISDRLSLNKGHHGLHHIGFIVDDLDEARSRVAAAENAQVIPDEVTANVNEEVHGVRPKTGADDMEHKVLDPNGVTVDLATRNYAGRAWHVSLS